MRITRSQKETDFLIYDADDRAINKWLKNNVIKAEKIPFTLQSMDVLEKQLGYLPKKAVYVNNNKISIKINKNITEMRIDNLALLGKHNVKNAMASAMAAKLLKVRKETIRKCLENFEGVEHRLEKVLKINGVQYINDSKATNINATYYALESMDAKTVWIVGGVDKGNDYDTLLPYVNEKVKAIVCLGVNNEKIISAFSNVVDLIVETQGAEEAVKVAYKIAEKGENVLLSPACASFDLFENYEDRGRQFKNAIRKL
jgi:UDP-N-acetylmuramoylalanine--D-glutamate ligase